MRVKTWKIFDYGEVPQGAPSYDYNCPHCGYEAQMPMKGRPLAQIGGGGIVFDIDEKGALPDVVQCRKCRRILTKEPVA